MNLYFAILEKFRFIKTPEEAFAKPSSADGNAGISRARRRTGARFSGICGQDARASTSFAITREFFCSRRLIFRITGFLLFSAAVLAQDVPQPARKPVLIRNTDIAEGKEPEPEPAKEPDPVRSRENLNIGNVYFKRRNYSAAISRYSEAIEWQEKSIPAHEALARAYEKNGDYSKAIQTLEAVIEKNPDSPKNRGFRSKIAILRKKLP